MDSNELLATIRARGSVFLFGQALYVSPPKLGLELAPLIRGNRTELVTTLKRERQDQLIKKLEGGLCGDCADQLTLQDKAHDTWWCAGCRLWWTRTPNGSNWQHIATGWFLFNPPQPIKPKNNNGEIYGRTEQPTEQPTEHGDTRDGDKRGSATPTTGGPTRVRRTPALAAGADLSMREPGLSGAGGNPGILSQSGDRNRGPLGGHQRGLFG